MCSIAECYLVETGYWISKKDNMFTRNRIIPYKLLNMVIKERSNKGIFCTAYKYNGNNLNEAFLYGDMYFDFDNKKDFEPVREDALKTLSYLKIVFKIMPEEVKIYFSGNKGVHIMVPAEILGIEPHKNLNGIFRLIAENVRSYTPNKTLDLVIYDNKRLFRIPQSVHESTGLYKIPITVDELRNLTHNEIKELAKAKRIITHKQPVFNHFANARYRELVKRWEDESKKVNKVQYKSILKCTPPCIKYLMENGASEGSRNNSIAAMASFYKNSGIEMNEAIDKISEWNSSLNSPPSSKGELSKTVRSIYLSRASYGCTTLKNVSICNEKECQLKKKRG